MASSTIVWSKYSFIWILIQLSKKGWNPESYRQWILLMFFFLDIFVNFLEFSFCSETELKLILKCLRNTWDVLNGKSNIPISISTPRSKHSFIVPDECLWFLTARFVEFSFQVIFSNPNCCDDGWWWRREG